MKKLLLLPLSFGLLMSCGEHTAKDTITELQNDGESLSDNYMTLVKFNDALVSEATLIDIELYKIFDLDEQNIPESQFKAELDSSLMVFDKIDMNLSNVNQSFSGGAGLLNAMKEFSIESRALVQFYMDNVSILSITEDNWTDEQLNNFDIEYAVKHEAYSMALDNFSDAQETYASLNNMELVEDADLDAETIYNNSTQEIIEKN